MATLATDDFNRANAATLGASWSTQSGAGSMAILSNQCNVPSDAGNYYSGATWPNDQWSQATILTTANMLHGGVRIRCSTSAATYYNGGCNPTDSSNKNRRIWKTVAGVRTSLGSQATDVVANDVLYLEAQGTSIVLKVNGTTAVSVTDSSIATGNAGLGGRNFASDSPKFDDWSGGDFGGGGGTTYTATLTATGAASVSVVRFMSTTQSTNVANAVTLLKGIAKTVSSAASNSSTLAAIKTKLLSLNAVVTNSVSVQKAIAKFGTVIGANLASIRRSASKINSASVSSVLLTQKLVSKSRAASGVSVASIVTIKAKLLTLIASASTSVTLIRAVGKVVQATAIASPLLVKAIAKRVAVISVAVTLLVKVVSKRLAASVMAQSSIVTAIAQITQVLGKNVLHRIERISRPRSGNTTRGKR